MNIACLSKKLFKSFLPALLMVLTGSAKAQENGNYNGFKWSQIATNAVAIYGYTGPGGTVAIPSAINGMQVTTITAGAFLSANPVTSLTIPSSVTNIGVDALNYYCPSLQWITVDAPNAFYSSFNGVLLNGSQTTVIQCPPMLPNNYILPSSVTSIGVNAFYYCILTNVVIPNSVTNIGEDAFIGCGLTSVRIPGSVTSIWAEAFGECHGLVNVCFEGNVPSLIDTTNAFYDSVFYSCPLSTIYYVSGTIGWGTTFEGIATSPCTQCSGTVTITGQVTCACDDAPIAGASVQIEGYSATSGSRGYYTINEIPAGNYTEIVSANNYISLTNTITIPSGSTTTTQNFTLSLLEPALDYFGVGVNWANVTNPPKMSGARGDLDATDLYDHLQTDLSSVFNQTTSVIIPLDATVSSVNNLSTITTQFTQFKSGVCPNDTVFFYVSSHGGLITENNVPTFVIGVGDDFANGHNLDAVFIANLLNALPSSTRKIVIFDACESAGLAPYLSIAVKKISILASAAAYPFTFNGVSYDITTTSSATDGTGVFTDAIDTELDGQVFNLSQLMVDVLLDSKQTYANLIGQNLNLRDSGSAIFTGLYPQLYQSADFTGNLASNTVAVLPPFPVMSHPTITNHVFQTVLTNMPATNAVAIELSTNLTSWLQVAFYEAAGTNVTFTFATTNNSVAFFRTKVLP